MTAREVILEGGSPWGFRMHGGADVGQPLRISRVNPGSKAAQRGVREGDIITTINGQPTRGLANTDAHSLLRGAGQALYLGLNQDASPKRRSHKQQQQQPSCTTTTHQNTPEGDTGTPQPCSSATTTIVVGSTGSSNPGVSPLVSRPTADTPASSQSTNQESKSGTSSPQRAPPNSATNTPVQEPTKSHHKSSSGGGRQKRSRRLKAKKKALKESICEPYNIIINEPEWEELTEITPLPDAVHASPLLSAEALCLSDDVEPRPDIPTVEELKQLLSLHLRVDETPKRKSKFKRRDEIFPPSLRRLEVIAEEDDVYEDISLPNVNNIINNDDADGIYEDVELQNCNTGAVFRAEQCYIYSDSDEEESEKREQGEYELLPCRVVQVISDEELSDNSIEKQTQDTTIEIIEINDEKDCDIKEEIGSPVNENNVIIAQIENNPEENISDNYSEEQINNTMELIIENNNNNDTPIDKTSNEDTQEYIDTNSMCFTDDSNSINIELNDNNLIQTLTAMNSSQYEENYETLIEESSLGIQSESFYDEPIELLGENYEHYLEETLEKSELNQEIETETFDDNNDLHCSQDYDITEVKNNQSQENEFISSNVNNIVNKFQNDGFKITNVYKNKKYVTSNENNEEESNERACLKEINELQNESKHSDVTEIILLDTLPSSSPPLVISECLNLEKSKSEVFQNNDLIIYSSIVTSQTHSSNNSLVLTNEVKYQPSCEENKNEDETTKVVVDEINDESDVQLNLEFEELYNKNYPQEIREEICVSPQQQIEDMTDNEILNTESIISQEISTSEELKITQENSENKTMDFIPDLLNTEQKNIDSDIVINSESSVEENNYSTIETKILPTQEVAEITIINNENSEENNSSSNRTSSTSEDGTKLIENTVMNDELIKKEEKITSTGESNLNEERIIINEEDIIKLENSLAIDEALSEPLDKTETAELDPKRESTPVQEDNIAIMIDPLQSMSFVTSKLAHILEVTSKAASILNQKLPDIIHSDKKPVWEQTIITNQPTNFPNDDIVEEKNVQENEKEEKEDEDEREFSLSEKTDSTYQLRQFLKSIREDMINNIDLTPTHSRSESLDSNCSLNTTVYCDIKSNNSSSSLSAYFNNSFMSGTQPKSLRKLCLDLVAQFPNGLKLMLDWGLATVEELDLRIQPKLNLEFTPPASTSSCSTTHRSSSSSLPATSHAEGCIKRGHHGGRDCSCWLSVPAYGPYFVCLSPAQQKILPQNVSPEKAAALLDLHYKVSRRRAYHEPGAHNKLVSTNMGLNEEQQEQRLKATVLSDWLALARSEQQQPTLRAKSPLTRFEKLNEDNVTSVMKTARKFEAERYHISKQRDIAVEIQEQKQFTAHREQNEQYTYENNIEEEIMKPCNPPVTENEIFREQMFSEYQQQMAERAERRQNKILRVSEMGSSGHSRVVVAPGAPESAQLEVLEEFANRARKRMEKLGISEEEAITSQLTSYDNTTTSSETSHQQETCDVFVLEGGATQLPKRIQEDSQLLLSSADKDGNSSIPVLAPTFKATAPKPGVWSPKPGRAASASATSAPSPAPAPPSSLQNGSDEPPPPPVWTPKASPTLERKEFRPVRFEATTPPLKTTPDQDIYDLQVSPPFDINSIEPEPPLRDKASTTISSSLDRKLTLNIPRLPRAQNPTVTLLQKAREGQLPRGALYLDHKMSAKDSEASSSKSSMRPDDILYSVKREAVSEDKKTVELSPKKYDGIGPTTREGIPIVLRSGIKEENYGKWYKRMYDSLHKAGRDGYPYSAAGGYASEPEPAGGYDSDIGYSAKYATLDRRRIKNKDSDFTTSTMPRSRYMSPSVKYACEIYKNQPGRIEDYEPGHSSISDKEAKLWWDEVMDIFDGHSEGQSSSGKPFMTYALKESGYESDSQLVFKRREAENSGLSPTEHKQAYKSIQSGGEVPLHGFRKPAPERPKDPLVLPSYYQDFDSGKESPHKFVECGEVTIHYRSPVRGLARDAALSEEELARRQEEAMRRIYQEERRRKYLQELHDMESRRHTDNFTPSQKSPIPLNRYDDFFDDVPSSRGRDRTPEPKMVARALYNFVGQSPRELTFRRGDIIIVRRQIDKNWYEGEHNASIGLFPFNYVEIIPYDGVRTFPKGPLEGKARAKFNFVAQTHLELSLVKGENVVLTRRVDDNWYEGRIGVRKGIFPVSYVEVIQEPGERLAPISPKPVASPASHSLLLNGSSTTHQSGSSSRPHQYNPYSPPSHYNLTGRSILAAPGTKQLAPVNQTLHIDTHSEPVPYRALYNYKPQNDDELELREGDTVFVMEKCDDGWYVGSSRRSGNFGTFPGNYVERE